MTIFFASIHLDETVYVMGGGGGFTETVMKYSVSETAAESEQLITEWASKQKLNVRRIRLSPAVIQDLARYAFPEDIIGIASHRQQTPAAIE